MEIFFEVIGWAGTAFIIAGYFLLSVGKISNGWMYQWFNLIGAIGLLVNGVVHSAWPSAILNVVWSAIAIYALSQLIRKRRMNVDEKPSASTATI